MDVGMGFPRRFRGRGHGLPQAFLWTWAWASPGVSVDMSAGLPQSLLCWPGAPLLPTPSTALCHLCGPQPGSAKSRAQGPVWSPLVQWPLGGGGAWFSGRWVRGPWFSGRWVGVLSTASPVSRGPGGDRRGTGEGSWDRCQQHVSHSAWLHGHFPSASPFLPTASHAQASTWGSGVE